MGYMYKYMVHPPAFHPPKTRPLFRPFVYIHLASPRVRLYVSVLSECVFASKVHCSSLQKQRAERPRFMCPSVCAFTPLTPAIAQLATRWLRFSAVGNTLTQ